MNLEINLVILDLSPCTLAAVVAALAPVLPDIADWFKVKKIEAVVVQKRKRRRD